KWNRDARRPTGVPWGELDFQPGADKHGVRKIRAEDAGFAGVSESQSEIAGSATQIQNHSIGAFKDRSKALRSPSAPQPIQLERQQMVQQIVTRRDLREHVAYFSLCDRIARGALRTISLYLISGSTHFSILTCP